MLATTTEPPESGDCSCTKQSEHALYVNEPLRLRALAPLACKLIMEKPLPVTSKVPEPFMVRAPVLCTDTTPSSLAVVSVPSIVAEGVVRATSPVVELTVLVAIRLMLELAPFVASVTPVEPVTLLLSAMVPLPVLVKATEPAEAVMSPDAVMPVPEVMLIVVLVPVTVPVFTVPRAVTASVLEPNVSVLPAFVKLPPLAKFRL